MLNGTPMYLAPISSGERHPRGRSRCWTPLAGFPFGSERLKHVSGVSGLIGVLCGLGVCACACSVSEDFVRVVTRDLYFA